MWTRVVLIAALGHCVVSEWSTECGEDQCVSMLQMKLDRAQDGTEETVRGRTLHSPRASCLERQNANENALRKIQERTAMLTAVKPWGGQNEPKALSEMKANNWNSGLLLTPYYPCFWSLQKTASVVQRWDGGKWVCGLQELAEKSTPCIAYSLGSNFDTSFEKSVSKATRDKCEIHIYDPTMGKDRAKLDGWKRHLPSNMHFHEVGIKGDNVKSDFPAVTLGEALAQNGHRLGADILKFDIEGYEFELLESFNWTIAKFGMVLFELHTNLIDRRTHKYNQAKLDHELRRMEDAGYRLFSAEPVCDNCIGQVELALVHKDWDPTCGFSCSCL